ncbi:thiol reductant ABC exporter subunit CydD [Limobrevibacterium gyesilva]|uniref:Thiol reductant ABC exporter subunit CydD n=1 Tax=Limobrevibacterium gyesilva TaxID=2991712 RepID=A0AA42CGG5_9PROT|nr:thiol reductant ABC exporter subunit CydD [Limobrevibacterium gyesilva]MCW3473987.1 thiol reductant ABC exporter subunit CydD [Limobrevibacterium gyesilva]
MDETKIAARGWLRQQGRLARRGGTPVVACGLAGTVLAVGQAACAAAVLDAALARQALPLLPLIAFALFALLRAGLGVLSERAAFDAGAAARRRLRTDALTRLLAAGPALLRRYHSAELTTVIVDRIEAVDGLFSRWIPAAALAIAGPVLVALAVLLADPLAAAILAGAGVLVPVAMALSGIGAAAASRRQFAALTHLQARFLDRVRGIATIVLAGRAEDEARALGGAADELRRRTMRVLRVAFLSSAALDCAAALALVVLAIRYGAQLAAGTLERPGEALFVLLLVPEFFVPLRAFSAAYQDRMHALGAAEALTGLPLPPPPAPVLPVRTVAARGVSVAFDDVRLTWDPTRGPALDGLTFRVPAGETVVFAGPSGAGKSTVIEILLGFVRPESGRVTLNGADIATLVPQALTRLIAWIGQRPVLFAGSIRDNIRFARPEATDAEVTEAARFARVDAFAADLPQGLDTAVGEGGYGLSGGQAQRVAIARAFLKNAPLLLLDEPTAHLDPATEAEVLDSLRRLTIGRTVILASHSAAAHAFGGRRIDIRAGRVVPARGVA